VYGGATQMMRVSAQLGALAERYFRDDPATAIFKLRQFAELLSKVIAAQLLLRKSERHSRLDRPYQSPL
jgi:hypothetical protein